VAKAIPAVKSNPAHVTAPAAHPPIPVGLATKSGLSTAILTFAGGAANLIAGGATGDTAILFGSGTASLLGVLLGRYWQASRVPPIVQRVAQIADQLLEQQIKNQVR
jgi:hypothetical protein